MIHSEIRYTNIVAEKKKHENKPVAPKRLTWWHPLFGSALDFSGKDSFLVLKEEEVGQLPMLIDIIILLREDNREIADWTINAAPSLFTRLNDCTVIEFKGPTDVLENGDYALSLSRTLAWTAKNERNFSADEITLVFIAPQLTDPFKKEIERLGANIRKESPGIYEVRNSIFETWIIESIEAEKRGEPLLSLVSPHVLKDPHDVFDKFEKGPYAALLGFCFRQIQKFKINGKDFRLRYEQTEQMSDLLKEVREEIIDTLTPDEKNKIIRHIPIEDRIKGIPVEERIKGIPLEERIKDLSEEEIEKLAELIKKQKQN